MNNKVKHILVISGIAVLISGFITLIIVLAINSFDFKKLTGVEYETVNYDYDGDYLNLDFSLVETDVTIKLSEDEKTHVVAKQNNRIRHKIYIDENDNTLYVKRKDNRHWYEKIRFFYVGLEDLELEVSIPKKEYHNLKIKTVNGNINFLSSELSFKNDVIINSVSGKIKLGDLALNNGSLKTTSGGIELLNLKVLNDLNLNSISGSSNLTQVKANNFTFDSTSGSFTLKEVTASDSINFNSVSGSFNLVGDADNLNLKSTSGNLTLNLYSEKVFDITTVSGNVSHPESAETEEVCRCKTVSGNIKIEIKA